MAIMISSGDGIVKLHWEFKNKANDPSQEPLTFHDAFRMHLESKKPTYEGQAALWKAEGRCPHCGELGRYHLSVAICSIHGEY